MRSYREYCPIARASEIVAERWTPLVIRNLLHGCTTFSEIARGVPAMSRSLLIKRLKELERAGVVRRSEATGRGYELTEAGRDLAGVIDALGTWGERWLEVTTDHADPGFVLWSWSKYHVDASQLPDRRVLVEFTFPQEAPRTGATGSSPSGRRSSCATRRPAASPICTSSPSPRPSPAGTSVSSGGGRPWRPAPSR